MCPSCLPVNEKNFLLEPFFAINEKICLSSNENIVLLSPSRLLVTEKSCLLDPSFFQSMRRVVCQSMRMMFSWAQVVLLGGPGGSESVVDSLY